MQRKINNDEPSKVAQECDNMIKVLTEKANIAFKNGCFVESAYKKTEVAPTTTPTISPTTTIKQ